MTFHVWCLREISLSKMSEKLMILAFVLSTLGSSVLCQSSFFDLSAVDIDGNDVSFEAFRGKVVLVVNVASECGFTDDHYSQLQKMFNILGQDDHFIVLGFPCNQFGAQEPGSNQDILVIFIAQLTDRWKQACTLMYSRGLDSITIMYYIAVKLMLYGIFIRITYRHHTSMEKLLVIAPSLQ